MPMVTQARRHMTTAAVEPPQISSPSCCGRCLYNIPQGTLIILMPGTVILLIGSFMTTLTEADSSYNDDLAYVSWLFLALGAITTTVGIVFWSVLWTRNKPPPLPPKKYRPTSPTESVQLVGVYKISDGHVNRAHTDDSGHVSSHVSRSSDIASGGGDNDATSQARHSKDGELGWRSDNTSRTSRASRTRAGETETAISSSDTSTDCHSDPSTDTCSHRATSSEYTNGDGHVNRAHTDDDGNVDPALTGDTGAGAGVGDGGDTNVPLPHHGGRGATLTV